VDVKRFWSISGYYPSIVLEGPKEATDSLRLAGPQAKFKFRTSITVWSTVFSAEVYKVWFYLLNYCPNKLGEHTARAWARVIPIVLQSNPSPVPLSWEPLQAVCLFKVLTDSLGMCLHLSNHVLNSGVLQARTFRVCTMLTFFLHKMYK